MAVFEADMQREKFGYRLRRNMQDVARRIHRLQGLQDVFDLDSSDYYGEVSHAELIRCMERRISDGRMLQLLKAWLVMSEVTKDD